MIYKSDSEKVKDLTNDEINSLRQLLAKHRVRCSGRIDLDIQKLVTEKDEKINELSSRLRQIKVWTYEIEHFFSFHCLYFRWVKPKRMVLQTL